MDGKDWFLLAWIGLCAIVAHIAYRRRSEPVRAAPDMELVLTQLDGCRRDFREDLSSTCTFFQTQLEHLQKSHDAEMARLLMLLEDQRRHIDGLTATTHALARTPMAAISPPGPTTDGGSEVMDDARELQIQEAREANGRGALEGEIDYATPEGSSLADKIVRATIAGRFGKED